jgi:hypothetical protein
MAEHDSKIGGLGRDDSEKATHTASANFATMNSRGGLLVLSLLLLRGAVACSDTPIATPASDGNYDDEGAPGNTNDPGGSGDDGGSVARDGAQDSALDVSVDATPDVSVDAATDAAPAFDGEADANPDADTDAGD